MSHDDKCSGWTAAQDLARDEWGWMTPCPGCAPIPARLTVINAAPGWRGEPYVMVSVEPGKAHCEWCGEPLGENTGPCCSQACVDEMADADARRPYEGN